MENTNSVGNSPKRRTRTGKLLHWHHVPWRYQCGDCGDCCCVGHPVQGQAEDSLLGEGWLLARSVWQQYAPPSLCFDVRGMSSHALWCGSWNCWRFVLWDVAVYLDQSDHMIDGLHLHKGSPAHFHSRKHQEVGEQLTREVDCMLETL